MRYFDPWSAYLSPWRLVTFWLGMLFLLAGARWSGLPDWDVPVSILMAIPAYLTAGPTLRVLFERQWSLLPVALYWTWFTVDGVYAAYWTIRDPAVYQALWHANAAASLGLYLACGLVWYPTSRGPKIVLHKREF